MSFWDDLFGGSKDPSKEANKYLNKIPGTIKPYYDPYINAGQRELGNLEDQYGQMTSNLPDLQEQLTRLLKNPGDVMNSIGQGYTQSPGYNRQVENAIGAANRAAAAGGGLGSNAHQENIAQSVNDIAAQDYYDYVDRAMKEYGMGLGGETEIFNRGLTGEEGLNQMGYRASDELANTLGNLLASQGNLAYQGAAGSNQRSSNLLSSLFSGAGSLLGMSSKPWWMGE